MMTLAAALLAPPPQSMMVHESTVLLFRMGSRPERIAFESHMSRATNRTPAGDVRSKSEETSRRLPEQVRGAGAIDSSRWEPLRFESAAFRIP